MAFYTYRDVEVSINNKKIIANSIELSQSIDISHPVQQGETVSTRNSINSPIVGSLRLNYYLTGLDPLKDYIYSNSNYRLSGNICGMTFNYGYLADYSLNAEPNSPINISVEIPFFDEMVGTFSPITATRINNTKLLNFNDSYFNYNSSYSINSLSNNSITNYQWNYRADIKPSYYSNQENITNLVPDNVSINEKNISAKITCDSISIPLSFMGENFAIELKCSHPTNSNIYELYACSGVINKRDFSISAESLSKTTFEINQFHLNSIPLIGSVITYTYPSLGETIQILSSNINPNGFLSNNENINLIERVKIGDGYVPFTITDGVINDIINVTITNNTINGYLTLETMKGIVQYPIPLVLDFPQPTITSFRPITGSAHNPITISGTRFHRITDVLFNDKKANFNIINNSGDNNHSLVAYVPDNATVGNIKVVSSLRNKIGISSQLFYPDIRVNGFNPTTGIWGSTITISGENFSGINGVYFGNTAAASYNVVSNNLITAVTPPAAPFTSDPYSFTKGNIKVKSDKNISGVSKNVFRPLYPITGLSVISGSPDEDLFIYVKSLDVNYMNNIDGAYKVAIGKRDARFTIMGHPYVNTFSGKIPQGFIGNEYISFYEPDGVTKYPGFTGRFYGIGPAPIITYNTIQNNERIPNILPRSMPLFSSNDLTIVGDNMKDFFGLSDYCVISGHGNEFKFSNLQVSQTNKSVIVKNVRITGNPDINTGYYTVYLKNFAGTGNLVNSGILITSPPRLIPQESFSFTVVDANSAINNERRTPILTSYISDNQYSNPLPNYSNLADIGSSNNISAAYRYWAQVSPLLVSWSESSLQNLTYFTDNQPREISSIIFYNHTGDFSYSSVTNHHGNLTSISALSGVCEILTGNTFQDAIGAISATPYQVSPPEYIARTDVIYFNPSGTVIIFPSPIRNFKGIRIKNNAPVTTTEILINNFFLTYFPINITEIKIY